MIHLYKHILPILLILLSINLSAQKGTVRGKVVENETGESLFYANVIVKGTGEGITTDMDGNFEIKLNPSIYEIEISFVGLSPLIIKNVSVKSGEVIDLNVIKLLAATNELSAVTVTAEAMKNTEEALISVKRKSVNVMDGISSAGLKKTGDSDAGDAAKRVTGVSVEGGKYVYVRGLGDRYTKTMLNGVDIPGLDPDRNAIQIDIFPTNLISNMTVLKSAVAEMPADFSGGVVNIETKDFPESRIFDVTAGTGYNPAMHFNPEYISYKGGKTDFLGFDDGSRSLPASAETEPIPNPVSRGYSDQEVTDFMKKFNPTLGAMERMSMLDYKLGFSLGNQFLRENGHKYGYIISTTYRNDTRFYENAEFGEYVIQSPAGEYEMEYTTKRKGKIGENNVLLGGLAGISYKTLQSKYQLTLMHLQNGESASGQFKIDNSEALGQSGYQAFSNNLAYSQRALTNVMLHGKHFSENENWEIDWRLSPTISKITEPDLRSTVFTITLQGDSVFNSGAGGNPNRIWRYLDEISGVGRIDFKRRMNLFDRDANVKFGGSQLYKKRHYNILTFDLQSFGGNPQYSGDPNEVLTEETVYRNGKGLYYNSGNGIPNANEYESSVYNSAVYVSGEFSPLFRLKTVVGLRAESFIQTHTGRDQKGAMGDPTGNVLENEKVLQSIDLFPSVNLIYAVTEDQNLRFSYFRSIARPSFKELSFAQILDPISNRIFNGGLAPYPNQSWSGNLHETRINNYDMRWEKYIENSDLFSVSLFAKFFNDPIEIVRIPEAQTNAEFQPRNVGDGQVYGVELEVRKNFAFIDPILEKFSFNGNLTLVHSAIEMNITEFEARKGYEKEGQSINRTRNMAGQSPYMINAGLSYECNKKGFNAGLFYNVKGKTLEIVGGGAFPDVYSDPFHALNFSAGKTFGADRRSMINLKVENLLNDSKLSFYNAYKANPQIFTLLDPGISASISFTYKFK